MTRFSPSPISKFQSTLPAGGATNNLNVIDAEVIFQSTLPAGGATGKTK